MIAALLLALAAQPTALEDALDEMIVTAERPNMVAFESPIAVFRDLCFDPLRRTREAAAPAGPGWQPLGEDVREDLGITDPATLLFARADHVRRHRLVLRIDRIEQPRGLTERRCTLTVIGGDSHARAQAEMAALFRSPGTSRHIGGPAGVAALPGWDQQVWTLMPAIGSDTWRDGGARRAGGSYLVVTDPSFYRDHDYVLGDLKVRGGNRPTSIMTLAVTSRRPLAPRR